MEGGGLTPGTEYGGLTCELYCIVRAMIEYSCRKETGDRRNCGVTTGLELRGERLTLSADLAWCAYLSGSAGFLLRTHARRARSVKFANTCRGYPLPGAFHIDQIHQGT